MHLTKTLFLSAAAALVTFGVVSAAAQYSPGNTASAVTAPTTARVAVANIVDNHIHSIALQDSEVSSMIADLANNTESFSLDSSADYLAGAPNGPIHTHQVILTKADLMTLQATGTVTVQSQQTLGHSHAFQFMQQCQVNLPSPSPTLSPSITPSESPSPSPTTTPTVQPSITAE